MKTASGATAVQIVWSSRRGSRKIEHIGSAHDDAELEALKAAARQRLAAGQAELDLGLGGPGPSGPLEITSSRMGHLVDALCRAYDVLGFPQATGGTRCSGSWCWPGSSSRPASWTRCGSWRRRASPRRPTAPSTGACRPMRRRRGGRGCRRPAPRTPGSARPALVLYDVSTLYFETDQGDGFREPGFSKERRLEPQITIGLLTGQDGFPLMVSAFEGNRAETKTMLPVIEKFMAAHQLPDVTVVADAGMISEANQKAIEAAGLSFILGMKIPDVPYQVAQWRREHPGEDIPDGHVFTQPWPAGPSVEAP